MGPATVGVNLTYETEDCVVGKAAQNIMIPISQPMDVAVDAPVVYGTPTTDSPTAVNLNMVNMGRAKALNVRVLAPEGISMAESYYGGDLLPGGSLSADIQVNCTKIGEFTGKLVVQYEDANGQQYTQEIAVPFNVAQADSALNTGIEPVEPGDVNMSTRTGGIPWWVWGLLAVLVIGAVVLIILSNRNKHNRFKKAYGEDFLENDNGNAGIDA